MVRVRRAGLLRARTPVHNGGSSNSRSLNDPGANDTPRNDGIVGSGEARERILDAAEDLFAADGFDATPTSRIARRAAVAKGLLFYYFPRKTDLLRTLFAERLPARPVSSIVGIAVEGDLAGSLTRLADRIGLTRHHSQVLSAILFREASTHPDVRDHLGALHAALMDVTEAVLDAASPRTLDHRGRTAAAGTFVAVLMHEANFHRFDGPAPDLPATAEILSRALLA
jgi:AcrR family transcriptional regulator